MNKKGFTLIELAMVLVIVGLLLGLGLTAFSILVKRAKVKETKEKVNAAVEAVLGYTYSTSKLPDLTKFSSIVREKKDAYGKDLVYIYDSGLTDYCGRLNTHITVEICSDAACTSPTQTVENVAFIVLSGDGNFNNQTAGSEEVSTDKTIKVYEYGVNVDNYSGDFARVEAYDDIVKWVTIEELHEKEACKPLKIDNYQNLPDAVEDTPYSAKVSVSGGKPPYTFGTWNSGSCNTGSRWSGYGLSLQSDGYITGTVNFDNDSNAGSITDCSGEITVDNVCVKDSLGDEINTPSSITIKVKPQPVKILTEVLPTAYEGSDYNVTLYAMGGGDSYSWNLTNGTLPDGLSLNNSTGEISGTVGSDTGCSNSSPYNFTVSAQSCGMTAYKGFSLTVIDPDCSSTASGGSGGSCSSINLFNRTGSDIYYIKGQVLLGFCIGTSSCTLFSNNSSVAMSSGECVALYESRNWWGRCRNFIGIITYNDALSADADNDCTVKYNGGLSDE
ncbi:prepilin-type N-terminal cleavage/methylation domain-containing protein [Persephonella hydrogeniphila]|uniref:Prepilin-type N-terminal cleavage/methylation domain-containing protein n=1 Tax=Persephonella hydrogeniphila TaxID=198703 RepID=A0A285N0B0_9AQUI|nr:Ig domain-containing protein [Persephonella hydrogeniphila]SNZ02872.1 prepilin-type N-terminal cleavage/methylation domain-containing protein [Persephonella hydrogeniphila]